MTQKMIDIKYEFNIDEVEHHLLEFYIYEIFDGIKYTVRNSVCRFASEEEAMDKYLVLCEKFPDRNFELVREEFASSKICLASTLEGLKIDNEEQS